MQVFVGGEHETQSVENMTRLVDAGYRYGIPVLGRDRGRQRAARDARYLGLATRICAELGAQVVKTYYCEEGFEQVTAGCPVPIVMAGGKKLPELEALEMAYRAVQEGAAGVDMGRNIFQSEAPAAMLQAVARVVHDGCAPERGLRAVPGSSPVASVHALMQTTARRSCSPAGPASASASSAPTCCRLGEELDALDAGAASDSSTSM